MAQEYYNRWLGKPVRSFSTHFASRITPSVHTWLGVYVDFSADGTAFSFSGGGTDYLYRFEIRHHTNFQFSNVSYSIDPVIKATYWPNVNWQVAPGEIILIAVDAIYELMEFDSGATKTCTGINLHLASLDEVTVVGTGCVTQ